MNENTFSYFLLLLPIVAFLYASVGHGGASGYLALMALLGFSPLFMKPTALLLNCLVSLMSFLQYYRTTTINWKLFVSLSVTSVPLAFIGGMFTINQNIYKVVLGLVLLIPSIRLIIDVTLKEYETIHFNLVKALCIGAAIGLLSGLIGIGGGILLSPLLIFLRWSSFKETACISALFIFVNSLAGLLGNAALSLPNLTNLFQESNLFIPIVATLGGIIGGYFGAAKLNFVVLRRILGLVLLIASVKLILT